MPGDGPENDEVGGPPTKRCETSHRISLQYRALCTGEEVVVFVFKDE